MKRKLILTIGTIAILYFLSITTSITPAPVLAETGDYTLGANEAVVTSYTELRDALATDNGITTVYFGANITMTGGIAIHTSKSDVVVSGLNPLDPAQTTPYTLTDFSSAAQSSTIYINNNGVKSLLITDLNIIGKNYYATFSAYDDTSTDGLVMTYQRVSYSGPAIGYNRRNMIRFIDCCVKITGENGSSVNQEFSEAKHLKFEGVNTIDFFTATWAIFRHTNITAASHGTFEVADDSTLTVTANSRSATATAYGAFSGLGGNVDITIGVNSVFNLETSGSMNGLSSGSAAYFSSFTVKNGGTFNLKTTKAATIAVMQMNGGLFIEDNASFIIDGYGGAYYALLIQGDGDITVSKDAVFHLTTGDTYVALLRLYGTSFLCYDPASVLLYNEGGRTIDSVTTASTLGKLHIEAEQVNYWSAASSGGFDNSPLYRCKKANSSNFVIDGAINTGTSGNFSAFSTNYSTGDSPKTEPTASTFGIVSARVLAFGRLDLILYEVNEESPAINGTTSPGAAVRSMYITTIGKYLPDVIADENGFYSIPLETRLPEDTAVYVWSNHRFLTATASTWAKPVGTVEMTVPTTIGFSNIGLSSSVQIAGRSNTAWGITIIDTRGTGSGWRVYARAPVPLTYTSGTILDGALVFVDDTGAVTPLDGAEPLLIEQHTATSDFDVKTIKWAADRGILARIPPNAVLAGKYIGSIEWILADTP